MKIQNHAMKNATIGLRYTRDEDGVPVPSVGDAEGVFEMSEKDAAMLLGTPGWKLPSKAPRAPVAVPTPGPLKAAVADGPAPPSKEETSEEDEAPDVDGLRTKADAQHLAAQWRAIGYEIPVLDTDTMKLSEMKVIISEALFADAEEKEG